MEWQNNVIYNIWKTPVSKQSIGRRKVFFALEYWRFPAAPMLPSSSLYSEWNLEKIQIIPKRGYFQGWIYGKLQDQVWTLPSIFHGTISPLFTVKTEKDKKGWTIWKGNLGRTFYTLDYQRKWISRWPPWQWQGVQHKWKHVKHTKKRGEG